MKSSVTVQSQPSSDLRPRLVMAAAIVLAGLLAYANSFNGTFLFDDITSIVTNPTIERLWPPGTALNPPPQTTVAGRPLVNFSLAINYALGGLDPWGYHAVNLGLHLLNGLLLFGLLRRTLRQPHFGERFAQTASWLGGLIALLWLVHPLQTEAVTYVIQRTELMVSLFYLLTLYTALRAWSSARPWLWYAGAIVACALGMLSKETMVTVPVLVLLYDRTFVSGTFAASLKRHWPLYAGLACTWLILAALLINAPRSQSVGFGHDLSPFSYLLTQSGALTHYLRLAFWPRPLVLSYEDWPIADSPADVLLPGLLILTLLAAWVVALWRRPVIGFAASWFFIILSPTSSFVPIATEVVAERRMYLPLAAIVTLGVFGVGWLLKRAAQAIDLSPAARPWVGAVVALPLIGAMAYASSVRNRDYASALHMWQDVVSKRPNNLDGRINLGVQLREAALTAAPDAREQLMRQAQTHFEEALRIAPDYAPALHNLGILQMMQGNADAGIRLFFRTVEVQPNYSEARFNLGNALLGQGRLEEAYGQFQEVLKHQPDSAVTHNSLGSLLRRQGRFDEARHHLETALRLSPRLGAAHINMGGLLMETGQPEEGLEQVRRGLSLQPRPDPGLHVFVAEQLAQRGRWQEAADHYREALRLRPGWPPAEDGLRAAMNHLPSGS